jgi:hypothetical protein
MPEDNKLQQALEKHFPETPKIVEKPVNIEQETPAIQERGPQFESPGTIERPSEITPISQENYQTSTPADALQILARQKRLNEREKKIEKILEDGLLDLYRNLPPESKAAFKIKGEETAGLINEIMEKTKYKVQEIISLIREWLMMIPGVNKFFLEQEAKLKADKIIELNNLEKI